MRRIMSRSMVRVVKVGRTQSGIASRSLCADAASVSRAAIGLVTRRGINGLIEGGCEERLGAATADKRADS